jgi:hypothetical protein
MEHIDLTKFQWDTTMLAALIGAMISILTWAISIFREGFIKRRERIRQNNNLLRYLSSLLHGAIKQTSFHINSLKSYAEQLDGNPYNYEPLHMTPKQDLDTITNKLSEEKYFNSYVSTYSAIESNVEEIKVIFSNAAFINSQIDKLLKMTDFYYADESKKRKAFSEYMQEFIGTVHQLQVNLSNTDPGFNAFFLFVTNTFQSYNENRTSPSNIEEGYNLFILPIVLATQQEYAELQSIAPLINSLRNAKNVYHAIAIHCKSYLGELKQIHESLIVVTKQLRAASSRIVDDFPVVSIAQA